MQTLLWRLIALVVSRPPIARYLIERSKRTPYFHLTGYMNRWWLFNGYPARMPGTDRDRQAARRWGFLPSIRIHHILREDRGAHPHDHPWDARTIILDGWYVERRDRERRVLRGGDTARILHGDFHHIEQVSDGGVLTLFITWKYLGTWGFMVDGRKIPHREYGELYPSRTDEVTA